MVNKERKNKFKKNLESREAINMTRLSNKENLKNLQNEDCCTALQSLKEAKHNPVGEPFKETIKDETEKSFINSKGASSEENFAVIELDPADLNENNTSEWLEVRRKNRQRQRELKETEMKNTQYKNINPSSNPEQKRFQSTEQRTTCSYKSNFQQRTSFNASGQKVKSCVPPKCNSSNKTNSSINVIREDSRACQSNANPHSRVHRNLQQESVNHIAASHEKTNIREEVTNSRGSIKGTKEEKQSEVLNVRTNTPVNNSCAQNLALYEKLPKCQFNKGLFSTNTQTYQQIENEKFDSARQHEKEPNLSSRAKKHKLKNNTDKASNPEPLIIDDSVKNKAICEEILKDVNINQKKPTEYIETTPNHCNQAQGDVTIVTDQCNHEKKTNFTNEDKLNNITDGNEYLHNTKSPQLTKDASIGESVLAYPLDIGFEASNTPDHQNRHIFSNHVYFLPNQPISIMPLNPYTAMCVFRPQFKEYGSSEIPEQLFYNETTCRYEKEFPRSMNDEKQYNQENETAEQYSENGTTYYWYRNGFKSAVDHDPQQYYKEHTATEQCMNGGNCNSNCFPVHKFYSNDAENRAFALSWVHKGVTYFQYYPDFAPPMYPCVVSTTGQIPVSSVLNSSYDADKYSSYNFWNEFILV